MRSRVLLSPAFVPPMLPSLTEAAPSGGDWIHEIKHDGFRTLLVIDGGNAEAWTRGRNDWSARYPAIVAAAVKLKCRSAVIDGEVVVQDELGRSDFNALSRLVLGGRPRPDAPLVYFAFDLLFLDGEDLRDLPLEERRARLHKLMPKSARSRLQFSEALVGDGNELFAGAERLGLEGIVSKRLGSLYRSGRTDRWRKTKCFTETAFVLIGTERKDKGPPTALLARHEGADLVYAGKAMITLTADDRDRLRANLEHLSVKRSPIPALRKVPAKWVKPELVVGVRHLRGFGGLRHATVHRLGDDN